MLKISVKRHEDSQDRNKITAIPITTYELIKHTAEYLSAKNLSGKTKQTRSVNDRLRNDITQFKNWLTRIIELKAELKRTINDTV